MKDKRIKKVTQWVGRRIVHVAHIQQRLAAGIWITIKTIEDTNYEYVDNRANEIMGLLEDETYKVGRVPYRRDGSSTSRGTDAISMSCATP